MFCQLIEIFSSKTHEIRSSKAKKYKERKKENNTFGNKGNLRTSYFFSRKAHPRKRLETFEESDGAVKKTYGTRLDMTVASFLGARVHSDVPRVTFFTGILRIFRGNRSSESTRFSEGLVLGNWAKTFHPRSVEVTEFVNIFMNVPQGGKFCFMTRKHS
jgi:hypothetical protein